MFENVSFKALFYNPTNFRDQGKYQEFKGKGGLIQRVTPDLQIIIKTS